MPPLILSRTRKRRIHDRLRDRFWTDQAKPIFAASNIRYELADRVRGLGPGGIGAMHLLGRRTGLVQAIDRRLHLLKVHLPYHESDHVLNIAYNLLAGGTCLEDIELWRDDEVYLDALGRVYVRIRKWNRHRTKGVWYPTKSGFVIPLDDADGLAHGIQAAARGHFTEKPDWLLGWEKEEAERSGSAEESATSDDTSDSLR